MPLLQVEFSIAESELPDDVDAFLREAAPRLDQFTGNDAARSNGFVPCDFVTVFHALRAMAEAKLAAGNSFCEWGSGLGVVASLAAMLEFDACGIEIERSLVDASRRLASDFGLPVEFVHGSFIPAGAEASVDEAFVENPADFFWLATHADGAYDELGLDPDDFDVVFAYPWPGEESVLDTLFETYAADGALLMTYSHDDAVRLRRKVR